MAAHRRADSENDCKNAKHNANDQQNGADHAADSAGIGGAAAGGIHSASIDFAQIIVSHDPRRDAERGANDQAENSEDQYESAAMWLHVSFRFG
jgi:hypothetical protein